MKKFIILTLCILTAILALSGYARAEEKDQSSPLKTTITDVTANTEADGVAAASDDSAGAGASAGEDSAGKDLNSGAVKEKPQERKDLNTGETPSVDEPTGEEQYRITAIEIKGNEHVPTEKIIDVVRSRVGDVLLEPRLRSDMQALYDMGYFTDVKVDTPYYAGGIKIVFRVQENPVVNRITIAGNKLVSTQKLLELIQTREGEILNMKTLNADMNEINYYYDETLGYLYKPTHVKDVNWTSDGELTLTIIEGMTITKIEVKGSSLFPDEKLMALVHMKPGTLFNSKEVKEDSKRLTDFYDREGYYLDTVRPQVDYKEGIVTIQLIEAVVEDIRLEWDQEKHKTKDYVVFRNIRTQTGKVLMPKKLQRDIERLNNLGYFSKVGMDTEPGSEPGKIVLVFKLQEQKTGMANIGVGYTGGGSGALRSGITAVSYTHLTLPTIYSV